MGQYLPLVYAALVIALFGSGVSVGIKWERSDSFAKLVAAQDAAIVSANQATAIAIDRAVSSAKTEADARIKAGQIRSKGELDALKKSRPECGRDAISIGLLHDAINDANGQSPTPSVVLDPMRPATVSNGWLGPISKKLGVQSGGSIWTVPKAP